MISCSATLIYSRRPTDMALSCAPPVYPEDTPAGGRRSCHPPGRPPAPGPRRPRGGGASAAAPCWAARLSARQSHQARRDGCPQKRRRQQPNGSAPRVSPQGDVEDAGGRIDDLSAKRDLPTENQEERMIDRKAPQPPRKAFPSIVQVEVENRAASDGVVYPRR